MTKGHSFSLNSTQKPNKNGGLTAQQKSSMNVKLVEHERAIYPTFSQNFPEFYSMLEVRSGGQKRLRPCVF